MYFYDHLRESRSGTKELYDPSAVRFADYYNKVQKAVIDESMQNAPMTSMEKMFYGGFSMKPLYLSKMTSIEGLENLNTSEVTSMQSMFEGCQSLTELDLSTFNTANVTNTNCMFQSCTNLETLNIALFNIGKMEDMRYMFIGCSKLKTIYCNSDWSGSEAQSDYMFSGCSKLVGGQGTTYNNSKIDKSYARPDDPDNDKPGYFTVVESVAVTIGATEWATFVAPYALNFLGADGLTAYIVTGHTDSAVETTEVSDVPANTPVLLNGSADTYTIPVIGGSATDVSSNKLVAGTGAAVEAEAGKTKYVLSSSDGKAVFKKINETPATVAWGKAYLMFDGVVEARMLSFDNETGINEQPLSSLPRGGELYNLQGQRIVTSHKGENGSGLPKGLYIVNGKKVIVK
jgi:surface protein